MKKKVKFKLVPPKSEFDRSLAVFTNNLTVRDTEKNMGTEIPLKLYPIYVCTSFPLKSMILLEVFLLQFAN
jgi:hypothetical protein